MDCSLAWLQPLPSSLQEITAILCYMKLNKKNKNISEVEAEMKPVDLDKHSEFVKGATVQDNELVM